MKLYIQVIRLIRQDKTRERGERDGEIEGTREGGREAAAKSERE